MTKRKTKENQAERNGGRLFDRERAISEAKCFTLFSDVFLSVALNDIPACQHVLSTLLGMKGLTVREVRTQYSISKVISHGARLDVLAEDESGKLYNIEIQRGDTVDHGRRSRFYGSMIDSEFLQKGAEYNELPEVYILYISEKDIWKQGRILYKVEKYLGGTGQKFEDGQHIMFINAAVDDGTEISELMRYFRTADPEDDSQGALSKRIHFLKCEEGGQDIMCEVTDRLVEMGKIAGIKEGKREGRKEGKTEVAISLADMGMTVPFIAKAVNESSEVVSKWLECANG